MYIYMNILYIMYVYVNYKMHVKVEESLKKESFQV